MTTRTALTKAKRGAAFLDAKIGKGWRRKIRRRLLDMAEPELDHRGCGCILTQLYGDYDTGLARLEIERDEDQVRLGFDVPSWGDVESDDAEYENLTEAWLQVLRGQA